MSLAAMTWIFLGAAALLFTAALLLRRIPPRAVLPPVGGALAVVLLLTAVFDNLMIAAGLFDYGEHGLSGLRIGLAPVEDLGYAATAVLLVPAVYWLAGGPAERGQA
ncbi:lycopene cyclase domain-containing protein [Zafaria sp. J156]|uniref:lycopene cyclase domain-containing protein n=1 Tax=Zafaria sp. J156 TaxID=3116490 RepID=UPI002E769BC2|nr:lycopene cyclase domain-containing protein [Zafaria sp. J156]MEE1620942.1 lycopene cyclase domain-containing protein [Zafaria sp. J156]